MDTNIERSLVLGLVRIFTAYGWNTTGESEHFADKVSTIQYGLHHGDAIGYRCHLSMLLQAREKDNQWGLFTPTFVKGIHNLLISYGNHNKLFDIKKPGKTPIYKTEPSTANVFKTKEGKEAIARLKAYGKTNIRYSLVEEYGVDRLQSDLREVIKSDKATVEVRLETHEPDELWDKLYDDGKIKMTAYFPIMPLVILDLHLRK